LKARLSAIASDPWEGMASLTQRLPRRH
jgi:hypothetical protein